jgi:hypothetical protein
MSLGNYASLALNEKGERIEPTITSPAGITLDIYKNWLNIEDPEAWLEKGRFIKPIVLLARYGQFSYQDLYVQALRGPQDGIYVVAYYLDQEYEPRGMIGCGVERYDDRGNDCGVTRECTSWFRWELNQTKACVSSSAGEQFIYDLPACFYGMDLGKVLLGAGK